MASFNTLELRRKLASLQPRRVYLDRPRAPKQMLPGEYAELLRQSARRSNARNRETRAATTTANDQARGFERAIPTSGPGRRRAKALRNKAACA